MSELTVCFIIPAYNAAATLRDAIASLQMQTYAAWRAIVVDDGSTDETLDIAREFAAGDRRVRVLHQPNAGEAAARNAGLAAADAAWIVFLDADDWLHSSYLHRMTTAVMEDPGLDVVHCGWVRVTPDGRLSHEYYAPEKQELFPDLARYNCFAVHAVMVRRALLETVGPFDTKLTTCPDWDLWQRVARTAPRFGHVHEALARYRLRTDSAGVNARQILVDGLSVVTRGHREDPRVANAPKQFKEGIPQAQELAAKLGFACWAGGLALGQDQNAEALLDLIPAGETVELTDEWVADCIFSAVPLPGAELPDIWAMLWPRLEARVDSFLHAIESRTRPSLALQAKLLLLQKILHVTRHEHRLADKGSASRIPFVRPFITDPVSRDWGFDRGRPVDRHYIETFLRENAADIRGRVLEVGDNAYTMQYGGSGVVRSDVLHVTPGNPDATIVADLTDAAHIADDTFDCIILTQTLQLIFDVPAAIRTLHRILKPGGVLLATVPGLSRTSSSEWVGSWFWRFTPASVQRLFEAAFAHDQLRVSGHGNVFTASAFLYGLAAEELSQAEFDKYDPDYDVIVAVRAAKPRGPAATSRSASKRTRSRPPALILLYHRVTRHQLDPWQISVTPEHFAEQLDVLQEQARVVPLPGLLDEVSRTAADQPLVAITFDDGYSDNLSVALPELTRHAVPATVFVATGGIPGHAEFWWDTLERVLLWPNRLPRALSIAIGDRTLEWDLGDHFELSERRARAHEGWRAWDEAPSARHALFAHLWHELHELPASARAATLESLIESAGEAAVAPVRHRSLSPAELKELASSSLIDIGAHSVSHSSLAKLSLLDQQAEIISSRSWLEGALARPVTMFSYPFGKTVDYSAATVQLVRANGFAGACTNIPGTLSAGSDPLQMPRLHVCDWDGATFGRQLQTWLANHATTRQVIT